LTNSYHDFALSKFTDFLPEIKKRQVLINQRVRVNLWLRRIEGSVIDLDDEGRLLLRTDPGRLITITAGKVHRIAHV
jgi:biotin-(acetyl-CoA carboxylase) ligase